MDEAESTMPALPSVSRNEDDLISFPLHLALVRVATSQLLLPHSVWQLDRDHESGGRGTPKQ